MVAHSYGINAEYFDGFGKLHIPTCIVVCVFNEQFCLWHCAKRAPKRHKSIVARKMNEKENGCLIRIIRSFAQVMTTMPHNRCSSNNKYLTASSHSIFKMELRSINIIDVVFVVNANG